MIVFFQCEVRREQGTIKWRCVAARWSSMPRKCYRINNGLKIFSTTKYPRLGLSRFSRPQLVMLEHSKFPFIFRNICTMYGVWEWPTSSSNTFRMTKWKFIHFIQIFRSYWTLKRGGLSWRKLQLELRRDWGTGTCKSAVCLEIVQSTRKVSLRCNHEKTKPIRLLPTPSL
jgi:hypothetical protein